MANGHNKRWWAAGLIQAHANATFGRAFLCGWTILQPAMPAGEAFASYFFYVCVWRGISLLGFLFQWNNQRTPPKKGRCWLDRAALLRMRNETSPLTYHGIVGVAYTLSGAVSIFATIIWLYGHLQTDALLAPLLRHHWNERTKAKL